MDDEVQRSLTDAVALIRTMDAADGVPAAELAHTMVEEYGEDPTPLVMGLTVIGRFAAHLLAMASGVDDDTAIGAIYAELVNAIADDRDGP